MLILKTISILLHNDDAATVDQNGTTYLVLVLSRISSLNTVTTNYDDNNNRSGLPMQGSLININTVLHYGNNDIHTGKFLSLLFTPELRVAM